MKNADVSVPMGADKARHVRETGAEVVVAGDAGSGHLGTRHPGEASRSGRRAARHQHRTRRSHRSGAGPRPVTPAGRRSTAPWSTASTRATWPRPWRALDAHGAPSVVVPTGLDPGWLEPARSAGVVVAAQNEVTNSSRPDAARADAIVGVVTTAPVAIAVTATIVLDHGPGQGPRALTLVPDPHVCIVRADQVVPDVPEAIGRLRDSVPAGR